MMSLKPDRRFSTRDVSRSPVILLVPYAQETDVAMSLKPDRRFSTRDVSRSPVILLVPYAQETDVESLGSGPDVCCTSVMYASPMYAN